MCLRHAGEFARRVSRRDVAIHEMGWRGGKDFGLVLRLVELFRKTRPHLVHSRNAESFFYGLVAARLAGVPRFVHSEHGRTFDDRRLRLAAQRVLTRYADAIFAVSEQLKRDLVRHVGLPSARIEVLYNGVDLDRFDRTASPALESAGRELLRAAWGVPPGGLVVGSVGRLVAVKNYPLLLRAYAASGVAGRIVLVGAGPERAGLEALAQSLGIGDQLLLLGHCDDVDRLLRGFDVFVLPSLSEGMSNTLLEAMAAGVVPIASDVGGNAEVVRHGVDGRLFPSGDMQALADALSALCAGTAERRALAAAARARARETFGMNAMIARYENFYEEVLDGAMP